MQTISELDAGLRLQMPATAANVALARQIIAGVTESLDIEPGQSADMKIAVTEACTNIVVHAYPHGAGPAELAFTTLPEYVVVSVRDRGVGFKPTVPTVPPVREDDGLSTGYGLALIGTLADEFSIMSTAAGTEVQMLFAIGDQPPPDGPKIFAGTSQLAADERLSAPTSASGASAGLTVAPENGTVALAIGPDEPVTVVLGRLVSLLAARADFSIDRLSDAQLVSDTLARHTPSRLAAGHMWVLVTELGDSFDLAVGTLPADGGRELLAAASLPGIGSLLEQLSDEVAVEQAAGDAGDAGDAGELVRLRLGRR